MAKAHVSLLAITGLLAACGSDASDPAPVQPAPSQQSAEHDASDGVPALEQEGPGFLPKGPISTNDAGSEVDAAQAQPEPKVARSALAYNAAPSTTDVSALASANRKFGFSLFQKVAADNPNDNIVFSPFSISSALAMTYAGARGDTETQMKQVLQFELPQPQLHEAFNATFKALASRKLDATGPDSTPFALSINNAVWLQRDFPIEPSFLDTLSVSYDAGAYLANFMTDPDGARSEINLWVDQHTEHLIPTLLTPGTIKDDTRLVLTNTVYFEAGWQTKFTKEGTQPGPFTKLDGSTVSAPMMHSTFTMPSAQGSTYDAVALPYEGGKLSFVAIVPKAGMYASVEQGATPQFFDDIYRSLKPAYVQITLPTLEYESAFKLGSTLQELGMKSPFDRGSADFTGMSSEKLWIDQVVHKAVIKVMERGTIAAAATAVIMAGVVSAPPKPVVISFDKPFMYAIYDEPTGEVLFFGRVLDPTKK